MSWRVTHRTLLVSVDVQKLVTGKQHAGQGRPGRGRAVDRLLSALLWPLAAERVRSRPGRLARRLVPRPAVRGRKAARKRNRRGPDHPRPRRARAANLAARSCKKGSLRKNKACVGTVVTSRSGVLAFGSARRRGRRTGAAISLLHDVDAALQRIVFRGERAMLRERPGRFSRERMRLAGRAIKLAAGDQQRVAQLLGHEAAPREADIEVIRGAR